MVYTRKAGSFELNIQAHDHWSNDSRQDAWFTASSLHAVVESMEKKPEWVSIISDNGDHYHNADLMMILRYWPDWYGIWPKKWIFLEPGEAKTKNGYFLNLERQKQPLIVIMLRSVLKI